MGDRSCPDPIQIRGDGATGRPSPTEIAPVFNRSKPSVALAEFREAEAQKKGLVKLQAEIVTDIHTCNERRELFAAQFRYRDGGSDPAACAFRYAQLARDLGAEGLLVSWEWALPDPPDHYHNAFTVCFLAADEPGLTEIVGALMVSQDGRTREENLRAFLELWCDWLLPVWEDECPVGNWRNARIKLEWIGKLKRGDLAHFRSFVGELRDELVCACRHFDRLLQAGQLDQARDEWAMVEKARTCEHPELINAWKLIEPTRRTILDSSRSSAVRVNDSSAIRLHKTHEQVFMIVPTDKSKTTKGAALSKLIPRLHTATVRKRLSELYKAGHIFKNTRGQYWRIAGRPPWISS